MSEPEKKSGGAGCFVMGEIAILVPVLYVLGVGPAVAIATRYPVTKDFLAAVYKPVIYLGGNFEPIRGVFDWYMELGIGS